MMLSHMEESPCFCSSHYCSRQQTGPLHLDWESPDQEPVSSSALRVGESIKPSPQVEIIMYSQCCISPNSNSLLTYDNLRTEELPLCVRTEMRLSKMGGSLASEKMFVGGETMSGHLCHVFTNVAEMLVTPIGLQSS